MFVTSPVKIFMPLLSLKVSERVAEIVVAPVTFRFTLPIVPLPDDAAKVPLIFTVPVFVVLPIRPVVPEKLTLIRLAVPETLFVDSLPAIVVEPVTIRSLPFVSYVPC